VPRSKSSFATMMNARIGSRNTVSASGTEGKLLSRGRVHERRSDKRLLHQARRGKVLRQGRVHESRPKKEWSMQKTWSEDLIKYRRCASKDSVGRVEY